MQWLQIAIHEDDQGVRPHREISSTTEPRQPGRAPIWALWALVALLLAVFFGAVLFGGQIYYPGDTARLYLPQRAALQRALSEGHLPWWTPDVGLGYPLLAEGEVAALYPLQWLALAWPAADALTILTVLHYVIAGWGLYLYLRALDLSRVAAVLGAMVFALGGFYIAHLSHVSILWVAAWLPWLLYLTRRQMLSAHPARWGAGLAIVVAVQFLAGHAQISLLGLTLLLLYAIWLWVAGGATWRRAGGWALAVALGGVLASPQLLPTAQLAQISQRAGGLTASFFTSYSFNPLLLATYLSPFVLGNPYPQGSVELMTYVGLLPLALAVLALGGRDTAVRQPVVRERWFWVAVGILGTFLAFGRWNPLYAYLRDVPVLNLFRVPARYMLWTSMALAVLAAAGAERVLRLGLRRLSRGGIALLGLLTLALAGVVAAVLAAGGDVERLVATWQWLPAVLLVAVVATLFGARRWPWPVWAVAAFLVVGVDLYAYGQVLDGTYNATWPRQTVQQAPRSLDFLAQDGQDQGPYRVYTREEIMPGAVGDA